MKTSPSFLRFILATALSALAASAQSGQTEPGAAAAPASADAEWAALRNLGRPQSPPAAGVPASPARARDREIAARLAEADRLRDFRLRHPAHAAATEAKRLEAKALLHAKALGDTAQDGRRSQLVGEIRRDAAIALPLRAEVAAFSDNLDVSRLPGLTRDSRLAAYERVARALNAEFPALPDGCESLVRIAKDSPDDRAQAIAREVLSLAAAPAQARAEAQILLDRHALVGRPLREAGGLILASSAPAAAGGGRPVIIYTWASFSPGSVAQAGRIAELAPAHARLVGVCLDQRDLAPARALAATGQLPGEQVFDWLGRRGELAETLKLAEVGLVYVADAGGVIRSVSAQRNLAEALAALAQP